MKKRRKPKLPASPSPHPCVVLGVDPGATSGWAIISSKPVIMNDPDGTVSTNIMVGETRCMHRHAVDLAIDVAHRAGLPLIVVAEKWTAGGWASHTALLGLGAAWGTWEVALREAGHPKRRIVRVCSQTWRARVIGGRQRPTEAWKAAAQACARRRFNIDMGPDAADATCIALWGMYAGEVGAVLPKQKAASR